MVKIKFDFVCQRKILNLVFIRLFLFYSFQKNCNLYLNKIIYKSNTIYFDCNAKKIFIKIRNYYK